MAMDSPTTLGLKSDPVVGAAGCKIKTRRHTLNSKPQMYILKDHKPYTLITRHYNLKNMKVLKVQNP